MVFRNFKGNQISSLGFGVMRLPTDPENPAIFDRKVGQQITDRAMALGINFLTLPMVLRKPISRRLWQNCKRKNEENGSVAK